MVSHHLTLSARSSSQSYHPSTINDTIVRTYNSNTPSHAGADSRSCGLLGHLRYVLLVQLALWTVGRAMARRYGSILNYSTTSSDQRYRGGRYTRCRLDGEAGQ